MEPRLCFVPHPAGLLHAGTLQTAVFTWTLSRHLGGDWVQSTASSDLLAVLTWLGLDWDEEVSADLTAVAPRHQHHISHIVADASWIPIAAQQAQHSQQHGWPVPTWLFLPPLVNAAGQPISGNSYLAHRFENEGYLPAALFNYLLRLSWQPASGQEIISKWEARQQFDPAAISREPAQFAWPRLDQLNHHYLAQLSDDALAEQIRPFLEEAYDRLPAAGNWLPELTALIRPGLVKLEDVIDLAAWAFTDELVLTENGRFALSQQPDARAILTRLLADIANVVLLDEQTAVAILNALQHTTHNTNLAPLIEAALTGRIKQSPIPKILGIIGKQRALNRLAATIRHLQRLESGDERLVA